MNKKGFTLVEILAVIVILALIIIIVATNGFGAFDNAKNAITKENEEIIKEGTKVLFAEINDCNTKNDEIIYKDLIEEFSPTNKSCEGLKEELKNGLTISLEFLIEKGYITNNGVKDKNKEENNYTVYIKLEGNNEQSIDVVESKAVLKNFYTIDEFSKEISEKVSQIKFVFVHNDDDYKDSENKWEVQTDESGNKIWAWTKELEPDKLILYVGSKDNIYAPSDSNNLFRKFSNVENIELNNFNTSEVTDMSYMFGSNSSPQPTGKLKKIKFSKNFKTDNVKTMKAMFNGQKELESLDLSGFDTSKVENMSGMFNFCSSLTNLDLNSFDTSSVTKMIAMFQHCSGLTELDLSNFNTSEVTDMSNMFHDCKGLEKIDLSGFNTSYVENMYGMFSYCPSLTSLDLSAFNTSNVEDMSYMFYSLKASGSGYKSTGNLKEIKFSEKFKTDKVKTMKQMFSGQKELESLDLSNFNTSNVTDMSGMFSYCPSLTSLDLSNFDTSNVTDMHDMFYSANIDGTEATGSLTEIKFSEKFKTDKVTTMEQMFYGQKELESLDLSSFSKTNLTNTSNMFKYCDKLDPSIKSFFNN